MVTSAMCLEFMGYVKCAEKDIETATNYVLAGNPERAQPFLTDAATMLAHAKFTLAGEKA